MIIVDRGTVFFGPMGTDFQSCTFPYICVLPTGKWLCSFRAAPTKTGTVGQRPLITWSKDEGKSWSEPFAPFVPKPIDGKAGNFRIAAVTSLDSGDVLAALNWIDHSNPSLSFFNEKTEGLLDTRIFLSVSKDQGTSWSEPAIMSTSPLEVPTPLTCPIIVLPDERWACQLELNKHYDENSAWRHRSVLMFSKDAGKTWPEFVYTSNDPENRIFYWDQRASTLANGRVLVLFWTYDTKDAVYLNIHARESLDSGRTWSDMWDTGIPGQPAQPISVAKEAIAMVYVDRTSSPVIKARVSTDNGHTWPKESEVIISETPTSQTCDNKNCLVNTWSEMEAFSIGLPATVKLPNDDLLTVFYNGSQTDHTEIQWARIRHDG